MDINEFVIAFAELLEGEDEDTSGIVAATKFKDLGAWSSMMVLSVLSMIKINYGVILPALDVNNCTTIADVYILVEKAHD
jgi:acyl carrier protein